MSQNSLPEQPLPYLLLIDDSSGQNSDLMSALAGAFEVLQTPRVLDPIQILEGIRKRMPALVLLDETSACRNDFALLRQLRGDEDARQIPVIVVTASSDPDTEVQVLELGAADLIEKPFNPRVLNARIRLHLDLAESQRRLRIANRELDRKVGELEASKTVLELHQNNLERLVEARTLEVREAHSQLSGILENLPLPLLVVDHAGRCTHWNLACEKVFSLPASEFIGRDDLWRTLYDEPRLLLAQQVAQGGFTPEKSTYRDELITMPDQEMYALEKFFPKIGKHLSVTVAPIRNKHGQIIGAIETLADISKLMEREAEAIRLREAAQQATESKSLFLANMSHEIRTPMNAIIGMADLCLTTALDDRQRNYVSKIKLAADSLLHIINDILDLSKIEAGKLSIENTHFVLESVFEQLSAVLALRAENQGVELNYDIGNDSRVLGGDPLRLGQVLSNLLSNALKFSAGGPVCVSVRDGKVTADEVELLFSVKDSGIGMSQSQIDNLFRPFAQADVSTTRKYGGTGLGLAISRHLVEQMGGEFRVESELGKGSTFTFNARFKNIRSDRRSGMATLANKLARFAKRPVLIVDDSPIALGILSEIVGQLGLKVVTAVNGEAAVELLKARAGTDFLAALVDWQLPGIDGLQTIGKLRHELASTGAKPIPMILVTAYSHHNELNELVGLVDSVLAKPVVARHIYVELARCLDLEDKHPDTPDRRDGNLRQWQRFTHLDILLAEDIEVNREVIGELLAQVGIRLRYAENGEEVLRQVAEKMPDLILMDCQMPLMDGYSATRKLRKQAATAALPIIALTANATLEDQAECRAAGMNGHVAKPVRMAELFKQLALVFPESGISTQAEADVRGMTPAESEHPNLPGIEVKLGLLHVGGRLPLFFRILRQFRDTQVRDFETLFGSARAADDHGTQVRLAHSLKGVAMTIGAVDLAEAAKALEKALSQKEPAAYGHLLPKLLSELRQVGEGLHDVEKYLA